ncbi:MAG: DUF4332 domain-containing protein [Hyphomicrobiaceae bacterium]|nr:DUF4332 domain-containing protein [Hyphomicrobiaceae bacterium]
MTLLFTITYAAYAKGTHHKLALDALRHLDCQDWEQWQRLFLKHARLYVDGAKAPDDDFKDFTNHVLHPRDGLWGGAPDKARVWYQHFVHALKNQDWPTAVYCAGVLSHYYTDPLMPFHTGQSQAENNIHRATEWSISKSYDDLRAQGEKEWCLGDVELPTGENWLAELVVSNARMSNGSYERLIAHYDITRGVSDPPAGLDAVGRRIVAELLRFAVLTYADVLGRGIEEAGVRPPETSLTGQMLLAAAGIPLNMIAKRIADAHERRLVQAMFDELQATGTVERTLPEDDRIVRDVHAVEVLAKQPPAPAVSKVFPFKPREAAEVAVPRRARTRAKSGDVVALRSAAPGRDGPIAVRQPDPKPLPRERAAPAPAPAAQVPPPLISLVPAQPARPAGGFVPDPLPPPNPLVADLAERVKAEIPERSKEPKLFLSESDDVVAAPSIGPKTAERLYTHGVKTVRDLLKAEPEALAALIDVRHFDSRTIAGWQRQAELVCKIPGLRGTHAQLLVGAGYKTPDAIAEADAEKLCADVLAFAKSADGQRVLRDGEPPDIEKIKGWLQAARSAIAA